MFNRQKSFTLIELIAMIFIIGILSLLSITIIRATYTKAVYAETVRKFYINMTKAFDNYEANMGFSLYNDMQKNDKHSDMDAKDFFEKYVAPYVKYTEINSYNTYILDVKNNTFNVQYKVYFADGTVLYLKKYGEYSNYHQGFILDVNGDKGPNRIGRDMYYFVANSYNTAAQADDRYSFFSLYYSPDYSKSLTDATTACKIYPKFCGAVLYYNNWKYPNDYPYKL